MTYGSLSFLINWRENTNCETSSERLRINHYFRLTFYYFVIGLKTPWPKHLEQVSTYIMCNTVSMSCVSNETAGTHEYNGFYEMCCLWYKNKAPVRWKVEKDKSGDRIFYSGWILFALVLQMGKYRNVVEGLVQPRHAICLCPVEINVWKPTWNMRFLGH